MNQATVEFQSELAQKAVASTGANAAAFDFSPASLQAVDAWLSALAARRVPHGVALRMGWPWSSYVLEVCRRAVGGAYRPEPTTLAIEAPGFQIGLVVDETIVDRIASADPAHSVAAVGAQFLALARARTPNTSVVLGRSERVPINVTVGVHAEFAVERAREGYDVELDYGEASIALLDPILADVATLAGEEPALTHAARAFGCYVLEVGRIAYGGVYRFWSERNGPILVFTAPDVHVALFTELVSRKRIANNDPAYSLAFLYQGFAERARARTPGTNITLF